MCLAPDNQKGETPNKNRFMQKEKEKEKKPIKERKR
jgi:hypothetical protein